MSISRSAVLYLLFPLASLAILMFSKLERTVFKKGTCRYSRTEKKVGKKGDMQLIVCVAVGHGHRIGILDIIESARCYLDGSYRIIVVDDSCGLRIWRAVRRFPEIDYRRKWTASGLKGLDKNLRKTISYVLRHYNFGALLKMDTDAIITGPGLSGDVLSFFEDNPEVGMLGSYRLSCTGEKRNFLPCARSFIDNWDNWKALLGKAQSYGYELGENVQGGAYLISYKCLKEMKRAGYLNGGNGGAYIPEDFLFSLRVKATGYEICDFAYKGPMAIAYRGLPISKEEVIKQNKKIVHSVKFTQEDLIIRDFFRAKREEFAVASQR